MDGVVVAAASSSCSGGSLGVGCVSVGVQVCTEDL